MDGIYSITRPELLTVTQGERSWQGADQLWYTDEWQQKAGCGPTAAAVMASYLAQTRRSCAPLYPRGAGSGGTCWPSWRSCGASSPRTSTG